MEKRLVTCGRCGVVSAAIVFEVRVRGVEGGDGTKSMPSDRTVGIRRIFCARRGEDVIFPRRMELWLAGCRESQTPGYQRSMHTQGPLTTHREGGARRPSPCRHARPDGHMCVVTSESDGIPHQHSKDARGGGDGQGIMCASCAQRAGRAVFLPDLCVLATFAPSFFNLPFHAPSWPLHPAITPYVQHGKARQGLRARTQAAGEGC